MKSAEENVKEAHTVAETNRRAFLKTAAAGAAGAAGALLCPALSQAETTESTQKEPYPRETKITPPGSQGHNNFDRKCVGCKLCIRACHNQVLRTDTLTPTLSFERGYCRPTCNDCSQVCPTGAILPIALERKSSTQIGRAVLKSDICLSASKGIHCRACSRICPSGAITFVASQTPDGKPCKVPNVNIERCIGCGACEYACPAKPLSAIHVEGNVQHHEI